MRLSSCFLAFTAFLVGTTFRRNANGFVVPSPCRRPQWSRVASSATSPSPDQQQQQQQQGRQNPNLIPATPSEQERLLERNMELVKFLKGVLFDVLYAGPGIDRSYARFYALETIARMPYFSYLSVLHLLETLGRWRQADRLSLHFAESWNELHHLLIMEELLSRDGPEKTFLQKEHDVPFRDRFIAQHIAVFYYWFVVFLYLFQPSTAYNLNQAVEQEAYQTYDKFLQTHSDYLKQQPAPLVAVNYYTGSGQALFDTMHYDESRHSNKAEVVLTPASGAKTPPCRRIAKCETLYDVFVAIRDDELEHAQTMEALQYEKVE